MNPNKYQVSYSTLSLFNKCKRAFKYRIIDKVKTESGYAAERGVAIHKKAEQFLLGNIYGMPPELENVSRDLTELKKFDADTETDLSFTRKYEPCKATDWDDVWMRNQVDAVMPYVVDGGTSKKLEVIRVVDFKTGRYYPEHIDQAEYYALSVFVHYEVDRVEVQMWYVDQAQPIVEFGEWFLDDYAKLKRKLTTAYNKVKNCKSFTKNKDSCKWCFYHKDKGGPCNG